MPALERTAAPPAPLAVSSELCGWGGGPTVPARVIRPIGSESLAAAVAALDGGAIARGMGRSYGDAAQLRSGNVVELTALKAYELDAESGILTAQAGITIAELLPALGARGFILPVLPGTQHVTVGGMLASDIHGKNHGTAGSVGPHVEAIGLLTSAG
jgi:decaprenylphospho-beta-D-ribofuranose 2-oxidase